MIRKTFILGGIMTAGLIAGTAGPALADSPTGSVDATATINSTLSVVVNNPTISYGSITPGQPTTVATAETPVVSTNNPAGAELTIDGSAGWSPAAGGVAVASGTVTTVKDDNSGGTTHQLANASAVPVGNNSNPGTMSFPEDFTVNFPSNQPPNNLKTTYIYTAIAN